MKIKSITILFMIFSWWTFSIKLFGQSENTVHIWQSVNDKPPITLNQKDDGYRGIWYMNQPSNDEYVYKYSGGLGTYCAKHQPFATYCKEVNKTFFCYGGTTRDDNRHLLHMVSYYDHEKKTVPHPTILLDKHTSDAHDNPVICVDDEGYIWIFSTSHGTSRTSYIHKSKKPFDIDQFEWITAVKNENGSLVPMTNFSYMQCWFMKENGFAAFFTRYGYPADRTSCFMTSNDGINWSEWQRLAAIGKGHYQISAVGRSKTGCAFNYHPQDKGLNHRTNLYYIETTDMGKTWQNIQGSKLSVPLTEADNKGLVYDYEAEKLNVYLKDITYDSNEQPIILYITSKGYQSGPENNPRTWRTACWTGSQWEINSVTESDNNYDMGSLYLNEDDTWTIVAPTETGPQPYNPGGEMAMWISNNQGRTWTLKKQLTKDSKHNHTYARRVINAQDDFIAFWADGHGRKPSESLLYFCNREGEVFQLPTKMSEKFARPIPVDK